MATLGFSSIKIGIYAKEESGQAEKIIKVITIDKKDGGAIEAKIAGLAPEATKLFASDTAFYVSSSGSGDTKLDLGIADLGEVNAAAILGATIEKGVMKITDKTKAPYCAVILESEGLNGDPIHIALAKGKFSRDSEELKTGEQKGKDPVTDSLNGEFISRQDGLVYAKGRGGDDSEFEYAEFEKEIFIGYEAPTTP
ncbi:major tail protein [Carnobacterium maltaromaticum]|uniref:major tail protein n=1 Tax=Carnobacterium maltaromaticum TaxID=2751 RepID=UPI00054EB8FF|nr:major tail protein [Carnobacterium maltaromaticum]KRN62110.1 hypothetical protein IV70_GL000206 [Carnobacterium maltaromaticum DSM 20342]